MTTILEQPIAANHPDYAVGMKKWRRCRDACSGTDAIKAGGTAYLPALSSHKNTPKGQERYSAYLNRALWFNASKRTMLGLSGAANVRPPKITVPETSKDLAKRIARHRHRLMEEQLQTGRTFILVTVTPTNYAYTTLWWAESIVNWGWEFKEGEYQLNFIVLEDTIEDRSLNRLKPSKKKVRHYYYLETVNEGTALEASVCFYEKWVKNEDEKEWLMLGQPIPIIATGGRLVDRIPGVMVNALGLDEPDIEDPVLLDLVDVNISHYQNSADLEHGRHWTALPTAVASGFPTKTPEGEDIELNIGGESAWITEVPGAQAFYLEFSGSGLGHLSEGMKDKQLMMAVLGSRLLEEQKAAGEASETIKTRLSGERSVLYRITSTTSEALTLAFQLAMWMSTLGYEMDNEEEKIELNTDFLNGRMSAADLQSLTATLQAGGISYLTYFTLLQNADVIPQDRTIEEEVALIDAGRPGGPSFTPPDGFMSEPLEKDEETEEEDEESDEDSVEEEVTANE